MNRMKCFLEVSEYIDWNHEAIQQVAFKLKKTFSSKTTLIHKTFIYVRDEIEHTGDYPNDRTTCKASDVLVYKTGWCYAKSHLLAALLRANGIATGLVYQRLHIEKHSYCLHGLNAVYLDDSGWYKLDARGNNLTIQTEFTPPIERSAFELSSNEYCLPYIYHKPLEEVIKQLKRNDCYDKMVNNFPDIPTLPL